MGSLLNANLESPQTLNGQLANRWQRCRWIAAIICFLICQSATLLQGQTASQQEYFRGLYRAYYERNPSVAELSEWVSWFRRGSSAEEVHASFLFSEEFFNRVNRNSDRSLNSVFQIVVGRRPTAQELNYWKQRFLALRQDRRAFGLEVLNSMGNHRPGSGSIGSSSSMDSLARQLSSQVRHLRNAVNQELPPQDSGFCVQLGISS